MVKLQAIRHSRIAELTKSRPMNRRIETFAFEYGDSGKVVYMAVQLENGDMKGPWGPMVNAVIP